MQKIKRLAAMCICTACFAIRAFAQTDTTIHYMDSVHGQRYCEIVLVKIALTNVNITAYNSLGYGACPEELWKNINTDSIKKERSVSRVVANGPRYYLVDKIGVDNTDTTTENFGGLQMRQWIKLRMSVIKAMSLAKSESYKERPFKLATGKFYNKGSVVYELVSPEHTFIMESYSGEVDTALNETALPNLAQRLKLPDGWQFKVVTLDDNLQLVTTADVEAFGLEDELGNRYQRIN